MRTWSFSIASKRAQDRENQSPDGEVMHVLLLGQLQFLCWPDVRAFPRMSDHCYPEGVCFAWNRRMSGPWPGCPAVDVQKPYRNVVCVRRMSGAPSLARCPGPVTYFSVYVCAHFTASGCPAPGPDVRPGTATYTPTTIFALPLYIAFFHPGRRLSNTFI